MYQGVKSVRFHSLSSAGSSVAVRCNYPSTVQAYCRPTLVPQPPDIVPLVNYRQDLKPVDHIDHIKKKDKSVTCGNTNPVHLSLKKNLKKSRYIYR